MPGDHGAPVAQHLDDARHGLGTEQAIPVHPLAQPKNASLGVHLAQPAIAGQAADEQSAGERADVDSG